MAGHGIARGVPRSLGRGVDHGLRTAAPADGGGARGALAHPPRQRPTHRGERARDALRASRGSVVFVTCTSATVPYRHYLPYVVSKGAVQKLMRALSIELAPEIRVNAVAPGTVLPPPDMDAELLERLAARAPLARIGTAEDIADAVVYLASAPFVTGQEIIVDGGRTVSAGAGEGDGDDPL
jgi:NAD(P)-dependent dehydrogenase (short-subunit alcohol dehydrogenase family)